MLSHAMAVSAGLNASHRLVDSTVARRVSHAASSDRDGCSGRAIVRSTGRRGGSLHLSAEDLRRASQRQPGFESPALPAVHHLPKDQVLDPRLVQSLKKATESVNARRGSRLSVHERVRFAFQQYSQLSYLQTRGTKSRPKHVTGDSAQTPHLEGLASHSENLLGYVQAPASWPQNTLSFARGRPRVLAGSNEGKG